MLAPRRRHLNVRKPLAPELGEIVVGAVDAPFAGAVNRVFGFRLRGVKGLDRVGVVVAEDARGVGGLAPDFGPERVEKLAVPLLRLLRRSAPVVVAHVQDVVLEILELGIRRLRAFEIDLGVL